MYLIIKKVKVNSKTFSFPIVSVLVGQEKRRPSGKMEKEKAASSAASKDAQEEPRIFEESTVGLVAFANRAFLSSNLPGYAAVTLYMICSFRGWVQAFNSVDEDPLSALETENINSAVSKWPVDPSRWNIIAGKLVKPWTLSHAKTAEELRCINLMKEFALSTNFGVEWADGEQPDTFIRVLSFYMGLYSVKALEWIRMFSVKYHIYIPYNMEERLSRWKETHPRIDHALLCMFTRRLKKRAIKDDKGKPPPMLAKNT